MRYLTIPRPAPFRPALVPMALSHLGYSGQPTLMYVSLYWSSVSPQKACCNIEFYPMIGDTCKDSLLNTLELLTIMYKT